MCLLRYRGGGGVYLVLIPAQTVDCILRHLKAFAAQSFQIIGAFTRLCVIESLASFYMLDIKQRVNPDPDPVPDPKADDPDKLEVRKGDKPEAPQTLANFNSESTSELEDSTFAAIDRQIMTNPLGSEESFQRMTPEQKERFLTEV